MLTTRSFAGVLTAPKVFPHKSKNIYPLPLIIRSMQKAFSSQISHNTGQVLRHNQCDLALRGPRLLIFIFCYYQGNSIPTISTTHHILQDPHIAVRRTLDLNPKLALRVRPYAYGRAKSVWELKQSRARPGIFDG